MGKSERESTREATAEGKMRAHTSRLQVEGQRATLTAVAEYVDVLKTGL